MRVSVLVVDDDARFRGLAARMITDQGMFVVGEAATVGETVELVASLRPEAVLVDVGLPDGDGLTLARRLAGLPWSPRIVLTSSDRDATTHEEALEAGALGFVPKDDLPDASLLRLLAGGAEPEYG
jgi:two-component system nitrate/nitrite response regulator NarL